MCNVLVCPFCEALSPKDRVMNTALGELKKLIRRIEYLEKENRELKEEIHGKVGRMIEDEMTRREILKIKEEREKGEGEKHITSKIATRPAKK